MKNAAQIEFPHSTWKSDITLTLHFNTQKKK